MNHDLKIGCWIIVLCFLMVGLIITPLRPLKAQSLSEIENLLWIKVQENRKADGKNSLTSSKSLAQSGKNLLKARSPLSKFKNLKISFGQLRLCGVKKSGRAFQTNKVSMAMPQGQSPGATADQVFQYWWESEGCRKLFLSASVQRGGLVCANKENKLSCLFLVQ